MPWLLVLVILSGPHLVLADAGGQDGLAAGQLVKHLDNHLRQDDLALGTGEVTGKAIWFHGTPAGPPTAGELLGQGTAAVLHELGCTDAEVGALGAAGAVQAEVGSHFSSPSYPAPEPKPRL